jgi:hypothetical protein
VLEKLRIGDTSATVRECARGAIQTRTRQSVPAQNSSARWSSDEGRLLISTQPDTAYLHSAQTSSECRSCSSLQHSMVCSSPGTAPISYRHFQRIASDKNLPRLLHLAPGIYPDRLDPRLGTHPPPGFTLFSINLVGRTTKAECCGFRPLVASLSSKRTKMDRRGYRSRLASSATPKADAETQRY